MIDQLSVMEHSHWWMVGGGWVDSTQYLDTMASPHDHVLLFYIVRLTCQMSTHIVPGKFMVSCHSHGQSWNGHDHKYIVLMGQGGLTYLEAQ